ncbi:hypothetical protein [Streptomyces malaysiensis]|uniref:Uncharacterized protein n=1 Tax=Streptomyces autolyticus TaxID=75293 RepID=A0ABN4W7Q9_9ACTN|nr:hypothetical protein [Streptomyces autolyticus]AQA12112.1 hypothetical protein BV401_18315 [Streptomyces autolyticus]
MRAATAAATAAATKTSKKLIHFNLHVNFDTSRLEEALIAQSLQQAVGVAIVFGSSVPVAMVSPDTAELLAAGRSRAVLPRTALHQKAQARGVDRFLTDLHRRRGARPSTTSSRSTTG